MRLLAALMVVLALPSAGMSTGQPAITYQEDRLTVQLDAVPLSEVLGTIARVTGAEVRGAEPPDRSVSAVFEALPVDEALRRLLGSQPFTLRYVRERLTVIELVGADGTGSSPRIALAPPPGDPPPITNPTPAQSEAALRNLAATTRSLPTRP